MLCEYCKTNVATYQMKNGKWCCESRPQRCPAIREKNAIAVAAAHKDGRLTTEHLAAYRGWSRGKTWVTDPRISKQRKWTDVEGFAENSKVNRYWIKEEIIRRGLLPYECKCGVKGDWNGRPLVLQLEHKNGIKNDHRLENLCFLCPNCHSQTETFAGRNVKRL